MSTKKNIDRAKLENAVQVITAISREGIADIKNLCDAARAMFESPSGYSLGGMMTIAGLIDIIHTRANETGELIEGEADEVNAVYWEGGREPRRVAAWEKRQIEHQALISAREGQS